MMTATGFRVLVKPDPVEMQTESGIVIGTDEKLEKTGIQRGVVISVGPGAWKAYREMDDQGRERNGRPWAVPGDYVIFARHAGRYVFDPFEPEKENEYLVMNDDDILLILEEGVNPVYENEAQKQTPKSLV